jgi:8-oxo-dGTP diphosphatase
MSEGTKEYPRPSLTADVVVIALGRSTTGAIPPDAQPTIGAPPPNPGLCVLLIKRARDPFAGAWALPGGFVEPTETVAQAAARELEEETALSGVRLVELGCFSRPGRDPRGWVVTIAHLGLVPADQLTYARAGDDAAAAAWLDLLIEPGGGFRLEHQGALLHRGGAIGEEPPSSRSIAGGLAFDHGDILASAVERLRDRVGELAFELLPQPFKLSAARLAFEAILGEPVDPEVFDRVLREGMVRAVTLPTRPSPNAEVGYVSMPHRRSPWLPER